MEDASFIRKIVFISTFFALAPIALFTSIFALLTISTTPPAFPTDQSPHNLITYPQTGVQVYAALPNTLPSVTTSIGTGDARPEIIRQYLAYYQSPLEPYAHYIVKTADKYGIDFRLITAIAQQESNLCKKIPPETHNCWGWGIHSEGTLGFESFEVAIDTVSQGLREEYIEKGYATIDEIMSKYTPSSPGSWAYGVSTFMTDME